MAFTKIEIHPIDLDSRKETLKNYTPDESEYKSILDHLRQLSNGEITGKNVGERRQVKLIDMFTLFFKNYKKSTTKITKEDLRTFKENLLNDKIKKDNGKPYSDETKEDCTETIVRYFEWKFPKKVVEWASATMSFRKWFSIRASKKTPEYLDESEIQKLYDGAKTIEGKYIIAALFDSGARIEEFLNIRFEDIEKPTANFPYYKIDFKEEYSKSDGRKIGLYWKNSTEAVSKYLALCENKDPKGRVFTSEYDAVRMYLTRLGQKVLNKRIHPHLLRKSSATYYADKLNRQQLCVRFGWKFSSEMPDVYISRAGVDEAKIKEVMVDSDLNKIQKENKELKTKVNVIEEESRSYFEDLQKEIKNLRAELNKVKSEKQAISLT